MIESQSQGDCTRWHVPHRGSGFSVRVDCKGKSIGLEEVHAVRGSPAPFSTLREMESLVGRQEMKAVFREAIST